VTPTQLRAKAEDLVNSLGIALYIRDGWIYQAGPGERVDPPKSAHSESHGRFEIAAAARP
jgi:hypothetical protein